MSDVPDAVVAPKTRSLASKIMATSAIYFGIVFAAGMVMGPARVLWLEPWLGPTLAVACEMPLLIVAMSFAARWAPRWAGLKAGWLAHLGIMVDDLESALVQHTHFADDRKPTDCLAVDISGDVGQPLIPRDCLDVIPAIFEQDWMNRCPAEFGVPEPQRRCRGSYLGPRFDVRPVPIQQAIGSGGVAVKTANTVRAIADYGGRYWPLPIRSECVTVDQRIWALTS